MQWVRIGVLTAVAVLSLGASRPTPELCTLRLHLKGLRSASGQVLYTIFNRAEGFPDSPDLAYRKGVATVVGQTLVLELGTLPPGTYAVGVVHDENSNNVVDTNLFGVPREGFGFSNDAKPRWNGPPTFEQARVVLGAGAHHLHIQLFY